MIDTQPRLTLTRTHVMHCGCSVGLAADAVLHMYTVCSADSLSFHSCAVIVLPHAAAVCVIMYLFISAEPSRLYLKVCSCMQLIACELVTDIAQHACWWCAVLLTLQSLDILCSSFHVSINLLLMSASVGLWLCVVSAAACLLLLLVWSCSASSSSSSCFV